MIKTVLAITIFMIAQSQVANATECEAQYVGARVLPPPIQLTKRNSTDGGTDFLGSDNDYSVNITVYTGLETNKKNGVYLELVLRNSKEFKAFNSDGNFNSEGRFLTRLLLESWITLEVSCTR